MDTRFFKLSFSYYLGVIVNNLKLKLTNNRKSKDKGKILMYVLTRIKEAKRDIEKRKLLLLKMIIGEVISRAPSI